MPFFFIVTTDTKYRIGVTTFQYTDAPTTSNKIKNGIFSIKFLHLIQAK